MRKTILGALTLILLVITAMSATAHSSFYGTYGTGYYGNYYDQPLTTNVPTQNQYFDSYYDYYGKDQKYERAFETWRYQQAVSPYMIVQSPYGKKPWAKAYGDNPVNMPEISSYPRTVRTRQTYTGTYKPSPYHRPLTYTQSVNSRIGWQPTQLQYSTNPFYGHLYTRGQHCHNEYACHYHNLFPDSTF